MKKEVKIYAPISGVIKNITDCSDKTFSKKMLGDGFLIIPSEDTFRSPFEETVIKSIFPTKHALLLQDINTDFEMLMHIGIDTVNLNGEPFNILFNVNEKILNENIVKVEFDKIIEHKLNIETMFVFESSNCENYKINIDHINEKVQKGDFIGTIEFELFKENKLKTKTNKYERFANEIFSSVGANNYNNIYNCMTRLRFNIIKKDDVNLEQIKKISIVKGINWAGNELQIIIGGEVVKVKDAFIKAYPLDGITINNKNNKISFKSKTQAAIGGVMAPIIPVVMTAGLLIGIRSILVQSGAIMDLPTGDKLAGFKSMDAFSGFMYIISQLGIDLMAMFFCVNVVKYMKGNILMGVFIGLTLANPYMMFGVKWHLFNIGSSNVSIEPYFTTILPQIVAGTIYCYLDRWGKKWMPTEVDVILRHFLCFLLTVIAIFLILGPILKIIEGYLSKAIISFNDLPFGLGAMLFAFLWQILVLTGMHVAVIMAIMGTMSTGQPSVLYGASVLAVFGQMAAGIGVSIRSKNGKTKQAAIGSLPAALFGITEPIIYSTNLPKIRPFFLGCVGAGLAGLCVGMFGMQAYTPGGMGILGYTRFLAGGTKQVILFTVGSLLSIVFTILLIMLFYKERPIEKQELKKTNRKLVWLISKLTKKYNMKQNFELKKQNNKISNNWYKENIDLIFKYEKIVSKISKLKVKEEILTVKQENLVNIFTNKIDKLNNNEKSSKQFSKETLFKYNERLNSNKYLGKINLINGKIKLLDNELVIFSNKLGSSQEKIYLKFEEILNNYSIEYKNDSFLLLLPNYYNAIHCVDISYNISDGKNNIFRKKQILKN